MSENKKYPIGGFAPGSYSCTCCTCKADFMGDKRAVQCKPCAEKMVQQTAGKDYAHIHVNLPSGGVATVSPDASPELLAALDKMVELAKDIPSPEEEGDSQSLPEELADLPVDAKAVIYRSGMESLHYGGYDLNSFVHAAGWMWRLRKREIAALQSQLFSMTAQHVPLLQEYKLKIEECNRVMAERDDAIRQWKVWENGHNELSAIVEGKNLENAQLRQEAGGYQKALEEVCAKVKLYHKTYGDNGAANHCHNIAIEAIVKYKKEEQK